MIEVVYKEEQKKEKGNEDFFKIPNNIRQIGDVKGQRKIYMEDYAYTFLKKISRPPERGNKAAILFGSYHWRDGNSYLFIRSALELNDMDISPEHIVFSDKVWGQVYEESKKYFPDQEIVGWFVSFPGFNMQINEVLLKTHLNHFSGNDKILFVMEPTEREEAFFAYENNQLSRQTGYYIYYEKNEAMQSYMIEKSQNRSIEETEKVPDRAVVDFRRSVKEKAEKKQNQAKDKDQKEKDRQSFWRMFSGEKEEETEAVPSKGKMSSSKADGKMAAKKPSVEETAKQTESGRIPWMAGVCAAAALFVVGLTYYRNYRSMEDSVAMVEESPAGEDESGLTQETANLLTDTATPAPTQEDSSISAVQEPGNDDSNAGMETAKKEDEGEITNGETTNGETTNSEITNGETMKKADGSEASSGTGEADSAEATIPSNTPTPADTPTSEATPSSGQTTTTGTRVTGATEYTIKRGDTLTAICRNHYGTIDRIEEVCQLNGISMGDIIYAGQKLLLPD